MKNREKHHLYQGAVTINRKPFKKNLSPDFPSLSGLEIGVFYQNSKRRGGDYYDFLKIGDKMIGVLADVSGHNASAPLLMNTFRNRLQIYLKNFSSLPTLLAALRKESLDELQKNKQFISCWLFEQNAPASFKFCGAGHPPAFYYRASSKNWSYFNSLALPLGMSDEMEIPESSVKLEKGDALIFYSDGLFDPRLREQNFDRARFCELIEAHLPLGPQVAADHIAEELAPHYKLLEEPDDIVLIILQRVS